MRAASVAARPAYVHHFDEADSPIPAFLRGALLDMMTAIVKPTARTSS
jgi:hypothetical protein